MYLVFTCKVGFDTAKNEPSKSWPMKITMNGNGKETLAHYLQPSHYTQKKILLLFGCTRISLLDIEVSYDIRSCAHPPNGPDKLC